jgi:hypothetical protein
MIGLLWLKVYYVQDAGVLWHHVNFGMPLQNRVDPFGNLFRTHARGTMMGNRGGALHNSEREIVRGYKSRRWIAFWNSGSDTGS